MFQTSEFLIGVATMPLVARCVNREKSDFIATVCAVGKVNQSAARLCRITLTFRAMDFPSDR
jgi:hypothetical protein